MLDRLSRRARHPCHLGDGYDRAARLNTAAAAAVSAGLADCAVGVESASVAHDLELVPLTTDTIVLAAAASAHTTSAWRGPRRLSSPACCHTIERLGYRRVTTEGFPARSVEVQG